MQGILETELVQKAQRGDRESYGRLVDLHAQALLAIAYSRVGNYAASQDVAQDAFLLAFEHLDSLRRPQQFGPWLRTIARNLCHRWHRQRAYRDRLAEDAAALRERLGYDLEPSPVELLERQESGNLLKSALDRLPEHEREALLLFYFQQQSVNAAAAAAGISPVAMRKRLQRARERLRDLLTADLESGLTEAGRESRTRDRVLAALPFGASFAKVAAPAAVLPGALALLGVGGVALKAAAVAAIVVTAGAAALWTTASRGDGAPQPVDTALQASAADPAASGTGGLPDAAPESGGEAAAVQSAPAASADAAAGGPVEPYAAGTVQDPAGNPVEGALVEALDKVDESERARLPRKVVGQARTDNQGRYTLERLPESKNVLLLASHPNWSSAGRIIGVGSWMKGVDIPLSKPTTASGVVVDPAGHPVPGATVVAQGVKGLDGLTDPEARDLASGAITEEYGGYARTTTGPDGAFTFTGLPEGRAVSNIVAIKDGYASGCAVSRESADRSNREMATGEGTSWYAYDLPLPAEGIRIELAPAGSLEGRAVLVDTGQPVEGALVQLRDRLSIPDLRFARQTILTARTDASGRFRFDGLHAGDVTLTAEADGLLCYPQTAPVRAAETTRDVELRLGKPGFIEGTVYDAATGKPLAGRRVGCNTNFYAGGEGDETDARGHYRIEGRAPGEWYVFADRNQRFSRAHHPQPARPDALPVKVEPGKTTRLDQYWESLDMDSANVEGRVVDAAGRPVSGAAVLVRNAFRETISDDRGSYKLIRLRPMPQLLQAFHEPTMTCGTVPVDFSQGGTLQVDIPLTGKAARIAGRLLDLQGNPVAAPLELEVFSGPHAEQRANGFRIQARDGAYSPGLVLPDRYIVRPYLVGSKFRVEPVDRLIVVEPGQEVTDADFVLTLMTGVVAGTVARDDGQPAAFVPVVVRVDAERSNIEVRGATDAEGKFRIEGIDGDRLRVTVGEVRGPEWAEVHGVAAGTEDLQILLQRAGTVKAFVTNEGQAAVRFVMFARDASGGQLIYGGEGGLAEGRLLPGSYTLEFQSDTRRRVLAAVAVAPGQVNDLGTVELAAGTGAIRGTVSRDGAPLAGLQLQVSARILDGSGQWGGDTFTRDGSYRIDRLDPGRYRVEVRGIPALPCNAMLYLDREVEVPEGGEAVADFDVPALNATITGTVVAGEEAPTAVHVFRAGACPYAEGQPHPRGVTFPGQIASAVLGANGDRSFSIGVPAGPIEVVAIIEEGALCKTLRKVSLDPAPDTTSTVTLDFTQ